MLSQSSKVEEKIAFFESLGSKNHKPQTKKRKRKDNNFQKNKRLQKSVNDGPLSPDTQRNFAAKEILSTETTYVEQLLILINCFKVPLSKFTNDKKYPNEQDIRTIFSNVESIYKFSSTILEELTARLKEWDKPDSDQLLGDLFIKMVPFLSLYSVYCTNYASALKVLVEMQRAKTDFMTFVVEQEGRTFFKLRDLLILPVQRIMRYRLLLSALLKETDSEHPDFPQLSEALEKVEESTDRVNNQIRQIENQNKLLDMTLRITGEISLEGGLIQPHRRFISEHTFFMTSYQLPKSSSEPEEEHDSSSFSESDDDIPPETKTHRNLPKPIGLTSQQADEKNEEERRVICFLFSDIFVVTAPKKDSADSELEWIDYLTLHDSFLKLPFAPNPKPLTFQYVNPLVTFGFRAPSPEEKELFKNSVRQTLDLLLTTDRNFKRQRQSIKLVENRTNMCWEAYQIPPVFCSRVTPEVLEIETAITTKMELHILLRNNHDILESRKVNLSKRSLVEGIKGMVSRFSPQKKWRGTRAQKISISSPSFAKKLPALEVALPPSPAHTLPEKPEDTQLVLLELEIERWERKIQEFFGIMEISGKIIPCSAEIKRFQTEKGSSVLGTVDRRIRKTPTKVTSSEITQNRLFSPPKENFPADCGKRPESAGKMRSSVTTESPSHRIQRVPHRGGEGRGGDIYHAFRVINNNRMSQELESRSRIKEQQNRLSRTFSEGSLPKPPIKENKTQFTPPRQHTKRGPEMSHFHKPMSPCPTSQIPHSPSPLPRSQTLVLPRPQVHTPTTPLPSAWASPPPSHPLVCLATKSHQATPRASPRVLLNGSPRVYSHSICGNSPAVYSPPKRCRFALEEFPLEKKRKSEIFHQKET